MCKRRTKVARCSSIACKCALSRFRLPAARVTPTLCCSVFGKPGVQDFLPFAEQTNAKWQRSEENQNPLNPVNNASPFEADAFCAWLTGTERLAGVIQETDFYRLPTDHEWSCAMGIGEEERSGRLDAKTNRHYPWGTEFPPPKGAGNFRGEESKDSPEVPTSVAGRPIISGITTTISLRWLLSGHFPPISLFI